MTSSAGIRFFLDGREYAYRHWSFVPRVGDEVMLGPGNDRKAYQVIRVVWGAEAKYFMPGRQSQRVNVEIEPVVAARSACASRRHNQSAAYTAAIRRGHGWQRN